MTPILPRITLSILFLALIVVNGSLATITVSIGNGLRISTGTQQRYRDTLKCNWECELVGCQLGRYDDECAYDCDKVCRSRYDYVGRSDAAKPLDGADTELKPKSSGDAEVEANKQNIVDPTVVGQTVRLYMPKNVTVSKFGIWERCANQDGSL